MMVRVYLKVRTQSSRAAKWTFPTKSRIHKAGADAVADRGRGFFNLFSRRLSDGVARAAQPQIRQAARSISGLERDVFYQSLFYLSALYFSWVFLLAATIVGNPYVKSEASEHYGLFLLCLTVLPLQGLWNCLVYFRPRRKARKSRHLSSSASDGMRDSNSFPFKNAFRRWRESSLSGSNGAITNGNEEDSNYHDPSAAIAALNPQPLTTSEDLTLEGNQTSPNANFDAIREELQELEDAEFQIEEYAGSDADGATQ